MLAGARGSYGVEVCKIRKIETPERGFCLWVRLRPQVLSFQYVAREMSMSKLLMCGVSAYLFFSGLAWGPACGMIVVLVTFWDYFSELVGELVEDLLATWTRRRVRSDLHASADPYWTLRALETCEDQLMARDLDSAHPVTFSIFMRALSRTRLLLTRSVSPLE